jgi:hypothetical protein
MAYKVNFDTYAICAGDKPGNIIQSNETIYTDQPIDTIESLINESLKERVRVCSINSIERVKGKCI